MIKIITISREFGCNARGIGKRLAGELGFAFYDWDLINLTAKKIGLQREVFAEHDEIAGNKSRFFTNFLYGSSTAFYTEKAVKAQADVIRNLAQKEDCIFFGRCSDYILREYPNCLHVFLYAPMRAKIKYISKEYELDEKNAESMIKKIDRQRHNYYKYVTGRNRGDRRSKHLSVDVDIFGEDDTVKLLADAARTRFKMN
ncbi:MAG: cytidylate kinase-like family protein [Clostridiales bacterium]|nr:cytidylate kinase-like family protein [Clostridiales bacterium]